MRDVHPVVEQWQLPDGRWVVRCLCGSTFTREKRDDAVAAHEGHFNVEKIRAQIPARQTEGADE